MPPPPTVDGTVEIGPLDLEEGVGGVLLEGGDKGGAVGHGREHVDDGAGGRGRDEEGGDEEGGGEEG